MIRLELSQIKPNINSTREFFEQGAIEPEVKNHPGLFFFFDFIFVFLIFILFEKDFFLSYVKFELQNDNIKKIQAIYWKAKKSLSSANFDIFEKQYESITK